MGLLMINESKCEKDGTCAQECPIGIILLGKENKYPERRYPGRPFVNQ